MNDKKLVNSHAGFGKLEEVWLGNTYPSSFYEHMDNEISDVFNTITEWCDEDLGKIEKKLIELGVDVCRPTYDNIDGFLNEHDVLMKPCIAPRDDTFVLGNDMYHRTYTPADPWKEHIQRYKDSGINVTNMNDGPWACMTPSCMVRLGKDIYVDWIYHQHVWGEVCEVLVELAKDYRIHVAMMDGHSDSVFCPVEDGLILSTEYKQSYSKTFPQWEVHNIYHSGREVPKGVTGGGGGNYQWYTPDKNINGNKMFQSHINEFAQDWVGDFSETVFDVNLLIVDDKNILAVGEDEETFEFLNKRGYNVHAFDFRGRFFFDSGMHCLTNDVRRVGDQPDLFPERGGPGLDWIID